MDGLRRPVLLVVPLLTVACVRWGVVDEPDYDDTTYDSYEDTTDYESYDDDTTTSTQEDVDSSSGDPTVEPVHNPTRTPRWPDPWPWSPTSQLVTWGQSGIPTANLPMFANIFHTLAGVEAGRRPLTIGWIGECDPRVDPDGCGLGDVQPFFEMIDMVGTIEFTPMVLDPAAYDVVVADFCGPADGEQLAILLAVGESVLALADDTCTTVNGERSADVANKTLPHFGVRFTSRVLDDPAFPVPDEEQSGLLEGVSSVDVQGMLLHRTDEPVTIVLENPPLGILLSQRSELE